MKRHLAPIAFGLLLLSFAGLTACKRHHADQGPGSDEDTQAPPPPPRPPRWPRRPRPWPRPRPWRSMTRRPRPMSPTRRPRSRRSRASRRARSTPGSPGTGTGRGPATPGFGRWTFQVATSKPPPLRVEAPIGPPPSPRHVGIRGNWSGTHRGSGSPATGTTAPAAPGGSTGTGTRGAAAGSGWPGTGRGSRRALTPQPHGRQARPLLPQTSPPCPPLPWALGAPSFSRRPHPPCPPLPGPAFPFPSSSCSRVPDQGEGGAQTFSPLSLVRHPQRYVWQTERLRGRGGPGG